MEDLSCVKMTSSSFFCIGASKEVKLLCAHWGTFHESESLYQTLSTVHRYLHPARVVTLESSTHTGWRLASLTYFARSKLAKAAIPSFESSRTGDAAATVGRTHRKVTASLFTIVSPWSLMERETKAMPSFSFSYRRHYLSRCRDSYASAESRECETEAL